MKADTEAIVIGQSLPLSGPWFGQAYAIRLASEAAVKAANAAGGIHGRQIELMTLDDQSKPESIAANLQRLVKKDKAVAIINCVGDVPCRTAAAQIERLRTPLVGVISGTTTLTSAGRSRYVIRVRPGYEQESRVLVRQLESMQIKSVAIIRGSSDDDDEQTRALEVAFVKAGIRSSRYILADKGAAAFESVLASMAKGLHQAVFLDVNPGVLDAMEAAGINARREWPAMVISLATPSMTQLALLMKPRSVGFTMVVPSPERVSLPLAQQFQRDIDNYATPDAWRFEGMEAYVNTRLMIEALRRIKGPVTAEHMTESLESLGKISLGGFSLNLEPDRAFASDYLEPGVTTKAGQFVR